MLIKYFYDSKLAQASYLVGCAATGSALVIDPARDITPYLTTAQEEGLRIEHVTETHIHADYVSGSRELAAATGAMIYLSAMGTDDWQYAFPDEHLTSVRDGDSWMVGNIRVDVLHTPGHTPEHIVFQITDTATTDKPIGIFTGDFLFAGNVGRPDLLEVAAGVANTKEQGAAQQFTNIQRFKTLPDYLHIWPGHGAGSACGKGMSSVPSTTLGYEKMINPAFQIEDERTFIDWLLDEQPEAPNYFGQMKKVNRIGPALLRELPQAQHIKEHPGDIVSPDALFIDTRPAENFATKHLPGTINIPISSAGFCTYVGWYVDFDKPTFFIAYMNDVQRILKALFAIGVDHVPGYFTTEVIRDESGTVKQMTPEEAYQAKLSILDVRGKSEYHTNRIPDVQHIPMGYVIERQQDIRRDDPLVVQCGAGIRSQIVISLLQKHGYDNLINMSGGIEAWQAANLPIMQGLGE